MRLIQSAHQPRPGRAEPFQRHYNGGRVCRPRKRGRKLALRFNTDLQVHAAACLYVVPEARAVGDWAAAPRSGQAESRKRHPKKSRRLLREGLDMKFTFIAKHRGIWPVAWICGALDVSRSGFHAWLTRAPSQRSRDDEEIGARIRPAISAAIAPMAHAGSSARYRERPEPDRLRNPEPICAAHSRAHPDRGPPALRQHPTHEPILPPQA